MACMRDSTTSKTRWLLMVCVICLLCAVVVGEQAWRRWRFMRRGVERPRAAAGEWRTGVNVELTRYDHAERERALDDISALGFHWLRQRFPWRDVEPQPGRYRWEQWDAVVAAARRHGMGLIAVLDSPPAWAMRQREVPLPCVPPWDEQAFARFASAFATRYGDYVDHYQVWDEPNLSRAWGGGHVAPCGYVSLLAAAYRAIHEADPTAKVLGGGLAPTQAPGPDNLNDLVYLRRVYAAGGGQYFDILAVKGYGFWSGPDDRRVGPSILNFSRMVAVRELMRTCGDANKPAWAVEWGWNSLPSGWGGSLPPWGSDRPQVQGERIKGAVARARAEWPWLEVMCWAEYQPALPPNDPRWGFALRDANGMRTALYDVLRTANRDAVNAQVPPLTREAGALGCAAVATLMAFVLAVRIAGREGIRRSWRWWASLSAGWHLAVLTVSIALYALLPWPEWVSFAWLPAMAVVYLHPRWALRGAALSMPLAYAFKSADGGQLLPVEVWLSLAVSAAIIRGRPASLRRPSALTLLWGAWVLWGACSIAIAPDPPAAWREWHTCVLGPALFYFCISRMSPKGDSTPATVGLGAGDVLVAWWLSGTIVGGIGIAQWLAGAVVPAGAVGRVTGVYYSPNHLALYLERVWPTALSSVLCGRLPRKWRRAVWAAVGVMGLALYLTFSRGAWLLALPTAMLVLLACNNKDLRRRALIGGAGVLAVAAIGVVLGRTDGLGSEIRIPVWQSTLSMIADHPWRGVGLGGFRFIYPRYMRTEAWSEPLLYHPHNVWLDATVRLGLPGAALFFALIVGCLAASWRRLKEARGNERAVTIGVVAGMAGGLAHGVVDSGYFLADLAWSLALMAGVLDGARPRNDLMTDRHQECSHSSASSSNSS